MAYKDWILRGEEYSQFPSMPDKLRLLFFFAPLRESFLALYFADIDAEKTVPYSASIFPEYPPLLDGQ